MPRAVALLMFGAISGCSTGVTYVVPSAPDNVAALRFQKPTDSAAYPLANGIYSIDDSVYLGAERADELFLAPGEHEIGVNCTQTIRTDKQQSIVYNFGAGKRYQLTCESGSAVIGEISD